MVYSGEQLYLCYQYRMSSIDLRYGLLRRTDVSMLSVQNVFYRPKYRMSSIDLRYGFTLENSCVYVIFYRPKVWFTQETSCIYVISMVYSGEQLYSMLSVQNVFYRPKTLGMVYSGEQLYLCYQNRMSSIVFYRPKYKMSSIDLRYGLLRRTDVSMLSVQNVFYRPKYRMSSIDLRYGLLRRTDVSMLSVQNDFYRPKVWFTQETSCVYVIFYRPKVWFTQETSCIYVISMVYSGKQLYLCYQYRMSSIDLRYGLLKRTVVSMSSEQNVFYRPKTLGMVYSGEQLYLCYQNRMSSIVFYRPKSSIDLRYGLLRRTVVSMLSVQNVFYRPKYRMSSIDLRYGLLRRTDVSMLSVQNVFYRPKYRMSSIDLRYGLLRRTDVSMLSVQNVFYRPKNVFYRPKVWFTLENSCVYVIFYRPKVWFTQETSCIYVISMVYSGEQLYLCYQYRMSSIDLRYGLHRRTVVSMSSVQNVFYRPKTLGMVYSGEQLYLCYQNRMSSIVFYRPKSSIDLRYGLLRRTVVSMLSVQNVFYRPKYRMSSIDLRYGLLRRTDVSMLSVQNVFYRPKYRMSSIDLRYGLLRRTDVSMLSVQNVFYRPKNVFYRPKVWFTLENSCVYVIFYRPKVWFTQETSCIYVISMVYSGEQLYLCYQYRMSSIDLRYGLHRRTVVSMSSVQNVFYRPKTLGMVYSGEQLYLCYQNRMSSIVFYRPKYRMSFIDLMYGLLRRTVVSMLSVQNVFYRPKYRMSSIDLRYGLLRRPVVSMLSVQNVFYRPKNVFYRPKVWFTLENSCVYVIFYRPKVWFTQETSCIYVISMVYSGEQLYLCYQYRMSSIDLRYGLHRRTVVSMSSVQNVFYRPKVSFTQENSCIYVISTECLL
ncbi:hypothetical protein KUTeg_008329 [Tegillarca granosa]|uniref:Uncharacterized protein n=1 Tax=Tegillarca granosa TaxID=220873 RepID=A0ABQ9FDN3_TEGGR|nr:hypothetical protein KUTeg_008329 [Tegillarca granosa]